MYYVMYVICNVCINLTVSYINVYDTLSMSVGRISKLIAHIPNEFPCKTTKVFLG